MQRIQRLSNHVGPSPQPLIAEHKCSGMDVDDNAAYIVSAVRTPIGSFGGELASVGATELGAIIVKAALERAAVSPDSVDEVFVGNVLSAGLGQAPAKQVSLKAGIPNTVPCTTVNKVCSSGMKAVMFGAQAIELGQANICVAAGTENMSQVPFYSKQTRFGARMGHSTLEDGMIKDGLWDVYNDYHMGNAAELCARTYSLSRTAQDDYAIESYKRAAAANKDGLLVNEIVPVSIKARRGPVKVISEDSEFSRVNFDKLKKLRPAFDRSGKGSVTAGNGSVLSDGSSALVLASGSAVKRLGLKPIAKIVSYADAAKAPEEFTTAPAVAMEKALARADLTLDEIDFFEINEAFSVVVLANMKLLGLPLHKVNIFGGAVSLGHPLGCSGSRILCTLANVLNQKRGKYGCAAICNGGGGASAVIIERM